MFWPPGKGKPLTAKALAEEASINIKYASGSEFVEIYVRLGAKRIRELFSKARANSPSIIYIDEIDALGFNRSEYTTTGGLREMDMTLNQLLAEMDGFKEDDNIIVVGSTNQEQLLDSALVRSGRFDKRIEFKLPSEEERKEIFEIHFQSRSCSITHDCVVKIAKDSEGMNGADIENIINQAGYLALRENNGLIDDKCLLSAFVALKISNQKFESMHNKQKTWKYELNEKHIKC